MHYFQSVYTVCSDGQEAVYEEGGSTKALAGSVLDSKSLTDTIAGTAHLIREREMSPTSLEEPSVPVKAHGEDSVSCNGSKGRFLLLGAQKARRISVSQNVGPEDLQPAEFYCADGSGPSNLTRQSASSDVEEFDPYKVHAIMDNLKQMLNDDAVDEIPVKKVSKGFK